MKLQNLISRADEHTIQKLLGRECLRLIQLLNLHWVMDWWLPEYILFPRKRHPQSSKCLILLGLEEDIPKTVHGLGVEDIWAFGKMVPLDLLKTELGTNLSDTEFEESINKLKKSGDIYQPKSGFVQLI